MSINPTGPSGRPFPPVYDAVDRYAWKTDSEFQSGLESIIPPDVTPEQAEELKMKAQCFYFERKFDVPIDFDEYKAWREYKANKPKINGISSPKAPASTGEAISSFSGVPAASPNSVEHSDLTDSAPAAIDGHGGPAYPPSFAELVELISTGKHIPGIKQVPSTVLRGQASESTKPARRKPWEKDDVAASTQTTATGTEITT